MVTEIELNDALVRIPQVNVKIEELLRNAQPSKEDRNKILHLSMEAQRLHHTIATWALNA